MRKLYVFFLFFVCLTALCPAQDAVWRRHPVAYWTKVLEKSLDSDKNQRPSLQQQWYAAYALQKYGSEAESAVEVLLQRFAEDMGQDDYVRAAVALALGDIGAEVAIEPLTAALDSEYLVIQRTVATALAQFPPECFEGENVATLRRLHEIFTSDEKLDAMFVARCAFAAWVLNQDGAVPGWVLENLQNSKASSVYHAVLVVQKLGEGRCETPLSGENLSEIAARLVEIIVNASESKSQEQDNARLCVEALAGLPSLALPEVRTALEASPSPLAEARLLGLLARLDDSEEAFTHLSSLVENEEKPECVRIAAIRGLAFVAEDFREPTREILVRLINDPKTLKSLVYEATVTLKSL